MSLSESAQFTKNKNDFVAIVVVLSITCLLPAGCYRPTTKYNATVSGTVTVDGELAPRGTVTFHPIDGGPVSIGHINSGGSYSLRTGQGNLDKTDGGTIKSGEYIATAFVNLAPAEEDHVNSGGPPIPGANIADVKYRSKKTSSLRYRVKPGRNVIVLNLDREPVPVEKAEIDEQVIVVETNDDSPAIESSKPEASTQPNTVDSSGADSADIELQVEITQEATP
jgi:hypothetical protein